MGLKKAGKKLLKLGQKAAKVLGEEGKDRIQEFFANATELLEREIAKAREGSAPAPASAKPRPSRRGAARKRSKRRDIAARRPAAAAPRTARKAGAPKPKATSRPLEKAAPAATPTTPASPPRGQATSSSAAR